MLSDLVSIIIPTRNRSLLLPYAIRSALGQTYKNIQIIVHDNNSSDETSAVVKPYLADRRVEYHRLNRDLTMTENWNSAFQYVRGKFFVRLDDDNVLTQDYVASALLDVDRLNLDVIIFFPLLIHSGNVINNIFDCSDDQTLIIDRYQWMYLEYFALTDTNYALYRTSLAKKLFPDGNIYVTSLPDRFLNYQCIGAMGRLPIRIGVNASIKGITRFDNQREKTVKLEYVNYSRVNPDVVVRTVDCHHNYPLHRLLTVTRFLNLARDRTLVIFFNSHITGLSLQKAVVWMGHIFKLDKARSLKEALIYAYYAIKIFLSLLRHPLTKIEGKNVMFQMATLIQKVFLYYARSFNPRSHTVVLEYDLNYGNSIVERLSKEGQVSFENCYAIHGSLRRLLNRLRYTSPGI